MQKDVVEMLYRVFDRNGLVLIPQLQFASPLTALERKLASSGSAAQGIELIGPDGRSWREVYGSNHGVAPYYNPLDPQVQEAVLDIVREFIERYHRHPSYRGISVEIDRRGYLQFPGIEWGCDDATLARFQHDAGFRVNDRTHLVPKLLKGDARSKWTAWRCAELARFYRRLASVVSSSAPQARLILACKQVQSPASEIQVCGDTRDAARNGDLFAQHGIDFSLLDGVPNLVVLRPSSWPSLLPEFDRKPPSESFREALAPIEKTMG